MISTLLFVNNNTAEQKAVKDYLKKIHENIFLISAFSSADALRILSLVTPDAVLVDYDVRNLEVYNTLTSKVPFFVITEKNNFQNENSISRGFEFHNKPTTDEEFSATLVKIIDSL